MTLTTDRLVLRPLALEDAPFVLRLVTQDSWLRFIGDKHVHDIDSAQRYLREGPMAMQARYGFALQHVSRKDDGTPIGVCGILKRDALPDPDLGFALLDEHAGHGYAFEAARAVIDDAETRLGVMTLLAIAQPDNARSLALLSKLGFQREGSFEDGALALFARRPPQT